MKTNILTLDQLHQEMEILEMEHLRTIIGGVDNPINSATAAYLSRMLGMPVTYGADEQGREAIKLNGEGNWIPIVWTMDELEVFGVATISRPSHLFVEETPWGIRWTDVDPNGQPNPGGGGSTSTTTNPFGVIIADQLASRAQEYLEELNASPTFKIAGYALSAYEAFKVVEDAANLSHREFAYKLSVIFAGAFFSEITFTALAFVELVEVMGKAYVQGSNFTTQWLHDRMNPEDANSFFSPVEQEVRDEWEAARHD